MKKPEEKKEEVEPKGQALAKRTCRGAKRTNRNVSGRDRCTLQARSGGHIGRVEKQLGLNFQVGGGRTGNVNGHHMQ